MKTILRHFLILIALVCSQSAFALSDQDIASITDEKPAAASTEQKTDSTPNMAGLVGRTVLALGAVLGLMAAAVWAARRWMPQAARSGGRQSIEILGQKMIGSRRTLMLVRVRGRTLLLGATPQSIQTLSEFDTEPADWSDTASFEESLRRGTTSLEQ